MYEYEYPPPAKKLSIFRRPCGAPVASRHGFVKPPNSYLWVFNLQHSEQYSHAYRLFN